MICNGLGITLSDFFSDDSIPIVAEDSAEDRKLIALYHSLKISDKKLLMTYAQALNREITE